MTLAYMDASALIKLVLHETESAPLVRWVSKRKLTSTAVARVEVIRAVRGSSLRRMSPIEDVLATVAWIACDDVSLARASAVEPDMLPTLDAIHIGTALGIGDDLDVFVTYDMRQSEAALLAGLAVESPK